MGKLKPRVVKYLAQGQAVPLIWLFLSPARLWGLRLIWGSGAGGVCVLACPKPTLPQLGWQRPASLLLSGPQEPAGA